MFMVSPPILRSPKLAAAGALVGWLEGHREDSPA
jgi:hypothetical protein